MRKRILGSLVGVPYTAVKTEALKVADIGTVEVTSEDEYFPVDGLFIAGDGPGWRASEPGRQLIRIVFDSSISIKRIQLTFQERQKERTQEFCLRWYTVSGSGAEIVRQRWNFSPQGSIIEREDFAVQLTDVAVLEIEIIPDVSGGDAVATLAMLQLGS